MSVAEGAGKAEVEQERAELPKDRPALPAPRELAEEADHTGGQSRRGRNFSVDRR